MKIAILHRYPEKDIKATNASFPYFVEELRQKGHTVDVRTFSTFNRFKGKFIKSLAWVFYSPLLVVGRGYDIIYCDDSFPYYAGLVKLVSPKSKVIKRMGDLHLMYYCSGWVYKFFHWFERWEWRACDILLPVSASMALYMTEIYPEEKKTEIVTILDPVDLEQFKSEKQIPRFDVMFHGYLNKNKNVGVLLEAAKQLPEYSFCILGDGPAEKELRKQAPENVYFLGWYPSHLIPWCLVRCRVGVAIRSNNPGNEYVYTQPFLQYWACGKPVVVSQRKCLEDYPYTFDSVESLVGRIRWLIENGTTYRYPIEQHDAKQISKELVTIVEAAGETKDEEERIL